MQNNEVFFNPKMLPSSLSPSVTFQHRYVWGKVISTVASLAALFQLLSQHLLKAAKRNVQHLKNWEFIHPPLSENCLACMSHNFLSTSLNILFKWSQGKILFAQIYCTVLMRPKSIQNLHMEKLPSKLFCSSVSLPVSLFLSIFYLFS